MFVVVIAAGDEKVIRRRNENVPLHSRKAEMTSSVGGNVSSRPIGGGGGGGGVLAVAVEPCSRADAKSTASSMRKVTDAQRAVHRATKLPPPTPPTPPPELHDEGVVTAVDSSCNAVDHSGLNDKDNYVVFEYPRLFDADDDAHLYSRLLNDSALLVMGNHLDPGYSSEKSPDDADTDARDVADVGGATVSDGIQHPIKEDDLLDDFFKFVSSGNV